MKTVSRCLLKPPWYNVNGLCIFNAMPWRDDFLYTRKNKIIFKEIVLINNYVNMYCFIFVLKISNLIHVFSNKFFFYWNYSLVYNFFSLTYLLQFINSYFIIQKTRLVKQININDFDYIYMFIKIINHLFMVFLFGLNFSFCFSIQCSVIWIWLVKKVIVSFIVFCGCSCFYYLLPFCMAIYLLFLSLLTVWSIFMICMCLFFVIIACLSNIVTINLKFINKYK